MQWLQQLWRLLSKKIGTKKTDAEHPFFNVDMENVI
jgi:hypothetical protein